MLVKREIVWLREVGKLDIPLVGGKGANLGELYNQGFQVPQAYVVTANAYFQFLEENALKEKIAKRIYSVNVEQTEELQSASEEARQWILEGRMNEELRKEIKRCYMILGERHLAKLSTTDECYVAVRSSATAEDLPEASFAGQQETFLNVKGANQAVEAVKKCWASLFTPRAIYYRKKQGFVTKKVGIAVIVQRMVDSEIAGVMFTAHPTSGDTGKIVIEAAYGLGEAVVSGSLTPDTYEIDKGSAKTLNKHVSKQTWKIVRTGQGNIREDIALKLQEKQKLSDKLILELAKTGRQIELHYGSPQDIEWAVEKAKLFIVQSRAITTLKKEQKMEEEKIRKGEKEILSGLAASPGIACGTIRVVPSAEGISRVQEGDILATTMTSPDWVPAMKKAIAIITDEGGTTSHAAIVSRELGIPCIVGTELATKKLVDGEIVTVDGFNGKIYLGRVEIEKPKGEKAEEEVKEEAEKAEEEVKVIREWLKEELKEIEQEAPKSDAERLHEELTKTKIKELLEATKTIVKVNVAMHSAAQKAAETGAEGVGLLRAEHMITESGNHPALYVREGKEQELVEVVKSGIKAVVEQFKEKPVWYRTFDARSDEFRNLQGGEEEPKEENPMLGWHGIRRSLDQPEMLKAEFKAIKELAEEGFNKIGVMLPFVQSVSELKQAKEIAIEAGLKPHEDVKFGIMVETPAASLSIEEFLEEGIDFVSFGTNDLTQLTLGIDRNNEKIQKLFTEMHPSVLMQCAYVIMKCKRKGVETSICGQAGSNPEMVKRLVRLGISSVSANIDAVEKIRAIVAEEEMKIISEHLPELKKEAAEK